MEYLRRAQIPNELEATELLSEAEASLVAANKVFSGNRDLAQMADVARIMVAALRREGMYGLQSVLRGKPSEDALGVGVGHLEKAGKAVRAAAAKTLDQRDHAALVQFSESILLLREGIAGGKVRVTELDPEQRKALRRLAAKLMGGGFSEKKRAALAKARLARAEKRKIEAERARQQTLRGVAVG